MSVRRPRNHSAHRSGFTIRFVYSEALANFAAARLRAVVSAFLSVLIGGAVVTATHLDVTSISERASMQLLRGVNVLVVSTQGRAPIPAQRCEGLAAVDGVIRAGGIASSEIVRTSLDPRDSMVLMSVSPSWPQIIWPETTKFAGGAVGKGLASRLGLISGSIVPIEPEGGAQKPKTNFEVHEVLPTSPRSDRFEAVAFYPASATENVGECLVESRPGAVERVESVLAAWFAPSNVLVRPLYSLDSMQQTPQQELDSRPSRFGPYLGFALLLAILLGQWAARKQDFALYRVLGLNESQLAAMLAVEALVTIWGPAMLGGTAAMIIGLRVPRAGLVAAELSLLDYVSLISLLLVVPAIGWLSLRLLPVSDSLRGRN